MLGEGAGVDAVYSGDFFFFEPLGERPVGEPVAVVECVVLGYYCLAVDSGAFVVAGYRAGGVGRRDAVVAQKRKCGD